MKQKYIAGRIYKKIYCPGDIVEVQDVMNLIIEERYWTNLMCDVIGLQAECTNIMSPSLGPGHRKLTFIPGDNLSARVKSSISVCRNYFYPDIALKLIKPAPTFHPYEIVLATNTPENPNSWVCGSYIKYDEKCKLFIIKLNDWDNEYKFRACIKYSGNRHLLLGNKYER